MIKVRIHIANWFNFMDDKVYLDIELPALPRKGDPIHGIDKRMLERQATASLEIAKGYAQYFYGFSNGIDLEDLKEENLKDLRFDDASYVFNMRFQADKDYVDIDLAPEMKYSWKKLERDITRVCAYLRGDEKVKNKDNTNTEYIRFDEKFQNYKVNFMGEEND